MATTPQRVANLQLDKAGTTLRVSLPKDVTPAELGRLNQSIIDKVIKVHTGCSCMSGQISVLLEPQWQELMQIPIQAQAVAGE